jgi:hypothetical protein
MLSLLQKSPSSARSSRAEPSPRRRHFLRLLGLILQDGGLQQNFRWVISSAGPWPRRFRYTGRDARHEHDGRLLKTGDDVALNETQAAVFADRFEPVAAEWVSA